MLSVVRRMLVQDLDNRRTTAGSSNWWKNLEKERRIPWTQSEKMLHEQGFSRSVELLMWKKDVRL